MAPVNNVERRWRQFADGGSGLDEAGNLSVDAMPQGIWRKSHVSGLASDEASLRDVLVVPNRVHCGE